MRRVVAWSTGRSEALGQGEPVFCLGAMMFGAWGNHEDSIRIIHHALDAGINFVDTADVYALGESERTVSPTRTRPGAVTAP